MKFSPVLIFVAAALLEVGGDAVVRRGLRGRSLAWILIGAASLAAYGLLVNSVKWDFTKLLGVYIGFFACATVLFGRLMFREQISVSTWCGLGSIVAGGLIMQFGSR